MHNLDRYVLFNQTLYINIQFNSNGNAKIIYNNYIYLYKRL